MNVHTQIAKIGDNSSMAWKEAAEKRIKALMEKWTANTLALGAELAKARERFPLNEKTGRRAGFLTWAKEVTGISKTQVFNLLQVHDRFGHRSEDIKLGQKVLMLLAQKDVPESARVEIVRRAERGERIDSKETKKIVNKHKLPGPKAANQLAKEEGRPVLSSDGNIYFGTDQQKAVEGADRRRMVYGVKDALQHLAGINLSGEQFLAYAFPHQLWTPDEAPIIKKALKWLTDLDQAWDNRT